MASKFTRFPSRSYEPLARRMCRAVYDLMAGKGAQWVFVTKLSEHMKVKDQEMLEGAIAHAAQRGWLMVGGQPVHSVLLTDSGEQVAQKKK